MQDTQRARYDAPPKAPRHSIAVVDIDGAAMDVSVSVEHDGIEWVGRLWFTDPLAPGSSVTDRGALPGRTSEAAIERARRLTHEELVMRYRRGLAERRRFLPLRRVTGEILDRIRTLNRVATSLRAGLMDTDSAAREIGSTEHELHELVTQLRGVAGDDDEP